MNIEETVINLRNQGKTLIEIAETVGRAKSTVYRYFDKHKIKRQPYNEISEAKLAANRKISNNAFAKRLQWQREGIELAKNNPNDIELAIASSLYWGEGSKSEWGQIQIVNTDVDLLKFFVNFLKNRFNLLDKDISMWIQYWPSMNIESCISFWKDRLNIPECKVYKPMLKKENANTLNTTEYGICRISVCSVELFCKLMGLIKFYGKMDDELKWISKETIAG